MSLYRRVSVRIWGDEKFRALSRPRPNAQTLFFYLMTGPHTGVVPGLSTAGERQLAEALEWPLPSFRRGFADLEAAGMAKAEWPHRVVYLPRAKHHNPPSNTNVIAGWANGFRDLPECPLTLAAWSDFAALAHSRDLTEAFRQAFTKAFGEGSTQPFRNSIGIGIGKSIGSGSGIGIGSQGPDALSSTRGSNETRPQASAQEQIAALAQRNGVSVSELKAQADALAKTTAERMRRR